MPKHMGLHQKHLYFRPQTSKAKRRASAASSTWAMRMMALHISGDVKLWAGIWAERWRQCSMNSTVHHLHFFLKLVKNSLSGEENNAPVITGGMAAENVLYDTPK